MTYQTIYSSDATIPMQADDLEELLVHAREKNGVMGISGALLYTDGTFLQVLEGEREKVETLMASIHKDVRHDNVIVLREGEIPSPMFDSWKMAYVSATPEQAARWAGLGADASKSKTASEVAESVRRTAQFARDLLAIVTSDSERSKGSNDVEALPGVA